MQNRRLVAALGALALAACTPAQTLIIRVPVPASTGVAHACHVVDLSGASTTDPPLQDSCDEAVITPTDADAGVPENMPNTRYVFVDECATMYEVRIAGAGSDSARVVVTCAEEAP